MKLQYQCIPCMVNQAIRVADMVGITDKGPLLKRVFSYLAEVDYAAISSPEIIGATFRITKEETGSTDPYEAVRHQYNRLLLDRLDAFENAVLQAEKPFTKAVQYAIMGNLIDLNPIHGITMEEVEKEFARLECIPLTIDHSALLQADLKTARRLLYLGDNCGEVVMDRLLLSLIHRLYPQLSITFATRGAPVVNDCIEADAYEAGIDRYAAIQSNGDDSLGTVLHRCSDAFRKAYEEADVIIAKGQANYECLSERKENLYYMLLTKCPVIAEDVGVPVRSMVLLRGRSLHPEKSA